MDDQSLLIETSSCTPVLFRTNYYSIEILHGVTAIILIYHPHHAKLQVLPIQLVVMSRIPPKNKKCVTANLSFISTKEIKKLELKVFVGTNTWCSCELSV